MELTCLLESKGKLLEYMASQQFSERYITEHRRLVELIARHIGTEGWSTFGDVFSWIDSQPYTDLYRDNRYRHISNLEYFCQKGYFHGNGEIQAALKERVHSCGALGLLYLQEHVDELISYMRSVDYSEHHIHRLRQVCNRIVYLSRSIPWDSYADIWSWYQQQGLRPESLQDILTILGILEAFHIRDEMPGCILRSPAAAVAV